MTTSRIRSNGSKVESSRRPATRVTRRIAKKPSMARRTTSTRASGEDRHGAVDAGQGALAVAQDDVLRLSPDGRRVHLEGDVQREVLPGAELAEGQLQAAVVRALIRWGRLDGVDGHAVEPAARQHQRRLLNGAVGSHVDARPEEQAAAQPV